MERLRRSRARQWLAPAAAGLIALALPGGAVHGGGWAVGSLDSVPTAKAGESVEVGFTILQHGVTPAVLDAGDGKVGIEVDRTDGTSEFFEAVASGEPGHYVATVSFPDGGATEWRILMGWFGPHELDPIEVVEPAPAGSGWSTWSRWTMSAAAAGLLAVALAPIVGARRRVALP